MIFDVLFHRVTFATMIIELWYQSFKASILLLAEFLEDKVCLRKKDKQKSYKK